MVSKNLNGRNEGALLPRLFVLMSVCFLNVAIQNLPVRFHPISVASCHVNPDFMPRFSAAERSAIFLQRQSVVKS